ncbi:MAG TPA: hypothetical protein VHB25_17320 [Gemmatimonadaceae bacterium]|nr:hypothetical protein [Gemmatimonadaceae bacterium]
MHSQFRRAAALALIAAAPLAAQVTSDDVSAYRALMLTPVGGLSPIATSTIDGEVQSGVALALRYGYYGGGSSLSSHNDFGATAVLPLAMGSTVSLTGGVASGQGNNGLMLSIGADTRITEMPFGSAADSRRLGIAVNGELGYGKPTGEHVISGAVGLPLSLIPGRMARDAMRIVPWVTPAFGFGNEKFDGFDQTFSGSRFMLGGGLAVYNPSSSLSFSAGVQYVSIQSAQLQIGLNVVLGGR